MTRWVSNPEPLTLLTSGNLAQVYHREEILRQRTTGNLLRTRVDKSIAKVLPAGSVLEVADFSPAVHRVVECAYRPYFDKDLFCLARMVAPTERRVDRATMEPPEAARVLERLQEQEGTPYLFGGSAPKGSPAQEAELLRLGLFDPEDAMDPELLQLLRSSGIDCSGLLNYATRYYFFGDSLDVYQRFREGIMTFRSSEAADPKALAEALLPLDLILFRGHVMVVIEGQRVIQAVGEGTQATTFAQETGWTGPPLLRYNRVVIDDVVPILRALIVRQGRTLASAWRFDDAHFMVIRWLETARAWPEKTPPACSEIGTRDSLDTL